MKEKWKKQDKVTSLQVAIQSLKLLHDTSNAVLFNIFPEIPCNKICTCNVNSRLIRYKRILTDKKTKFSIFTK